MSNRIEYAKASPAGYKAFGGVHVYLQTAAFQKNSSILCICGFRKSMAAHIASICIPAICSSSA